VLSAALVFVGTSIFTLHPRGFAAVNATIVAAWLFLAWRVGRQYAQLTGEQARKASAGAPA
jgi:hypothetical protein